MSRIVADTKGTEEEGLHMYLNSEEGTLEIIQDVDTILTSVILAKETYQVLVSAGIEEV